MEESRLRFGGDDSDLGQSVEPGDRRLAHSALDEFEAADRNSRAQPRTSPKALCRALRFWNIFAPATHDEADEYARLVGDVSSPPWRPASR